MDDAFPVCLSKGRADLFCNMDDRVRFDRPALNHIIQPHALYEFHHKERNSIRGFSEIEDLGDIGMIQR